MKPSIQQVSLSAVIFDPKLYPRKVHDPKLVQKYAECMDQIEAAGHFITLSHDLRLIDGRHRHLAYLTLYPDKPHTINALVYPQLDEPRLFDLAAQLNSQAGWQLTDDDKRAAAIRMYSREAGRLTQDEIARTLSVRKESVSRWLSAILEEEKKQREEQMLSLYLSCHTQEQIAEAVGLDRTVVTKRLQELCKQFQGNDMHNFRNFEPQLYSVWNFPAATNQVRHFGNIPPEIIDNLLYYYTQPFDVVFDPFAGGGSTIDKCIERKRRYYASDLTPIPARTDIRAHDITQGLPDDLPVPDLVFLDPPYWKQAEGKYSNKPTDLGNVELEAFLSTIADIAKQVKRKWNGNHRGKLAIIIGPCKEDSTYTDLAYLCYERIVKYLQPVQRFIVPYSTQIHGGAYVQMAKERKEVLYLHRDLMIFGG